MDSELSSVYIADATEMSGGKVLKRYTRVFINHSGYLNFRTTLINGGVVTDADTVYITCGVSRPDTRWKVIKFEHHEGKVFRQS